MFPESDTYTISTAHHPRPHHHHLTLKYLQQYLTRSPFLCHHPSAVYSPHGIKSDRLSPRILHGFHVTQSKIQSLQTASRPHVPHYFSDLMTSPLCFAQSSFIRNVSLGHHSLQGNLGNKTF